MRLGRIDCSSPARGLAEALVLGPVLVADPLLEAEYRLQCEQSEGTARAVSVERQGEVTEEALRRRFDEVPEAGTLGLPTELERRCVVHDDDPR
jgi:hypothetical protein